MNLSKKTSSTRKATTSKKKDKKENESLEQGEQRLAKVREYSNRRDNKQQNESPQEKKLDLKNNNFKREGQGKMNL